MRAHGGKLPLMKLGLTADEVLTTTRSVRKRLDLTTPVSREVIMEALQIALQAPTGSFSQGWSWMFVEGVKGRALATPTGWTALRPEVNGEVSGPSAERTPQDGCMSGRPQLGSLARADSAG